MNTRQTLEELRNEYLSALQEQTGIEQCADREEEFYQDALAEFEENNPDLVARRNEARAKRDAHAAKLAELKEAIRVQIENHYEETGEKVPFEDDYFLMQERLDWQFDDAELVSAVVEQAIRHMLTSNKLMLVSAETEEPVELSSTHVQSVIDFAEKMLKLAPAKKELRAFITEHINKERNHQGEMVLEVPESISWLPLEFFVKLVTVISDKKLLSAHSE